MAAGTIAFADTSRPLPQSFTELTVYTKDVAEQSAASNTCAHSAYLTH